MLTISRCDDLFASLALTACAETPRLTPTVIEELQANNKGAEVPSLSRRENALLQMVAFGASIHTIAHELEISPNTVKTHLRRVFEKMASNRPPDPPPASA